MTKYSKINVVYRLQKWMDSVAGQTFLNYAYSWGAAIVVLGALFKLIHLPGADVMLILGMGTEVVVFFLSAFDRPFDKTTDWSGSCSAVCRCHGFCCSVGCSEETNHRGANSFVCSYCTSCNGGRRDGRGAATICGGVATAHVII